ncbi:MAG: toxin TcdB middle/N-terminal domain-containing protein [Candidatus Binatia bacterium]
MTHRSTTVVVSLVVFVALVAAARADTGSALGDRSGEGSTPFSGLAQAPEANLFTGALTTAIPISVPPGRRSMTPELALRYTSGGGAGPFGHGWDLTIGRIERSTVHGVPRCAYPQGDEFVLVLPTGAAELVRETPTSTFHRPKFEQTYVRAERQESSNQWTVTDRSGLRYTFGNTDAARVGNSTPLIFGASDAAGNCRLTTQWALTRIEDPNGNTIDITWGKILNVLIPITVRWGGNSQGVAHVYTVRFYQEFRPSGDRPISLRNGVTARLTRRIFAIDVESDLPAAGTLVRSYALQYADDAAGATAQGVQSLLSAVTASGQPTQHLIYTPSVTGHLDGVDLLRPAGAYNFLRVANDSLEVAQSVMDMNGDGLLDLVRSDDAPVATWAVYFGFVDDDTFGFRSPIAWQAPGNWLYLRNVLVSSAGCDGGGWMCTSTDTLDLTGDGIADHVVASNSAYWLVYPGRGVPQWGFSPTPLTWLTRRAYLRRSYEGDIYQDVVDMNGDGLADLVVSSATQTQPYRWDVYLNTGTGFANAPLPVFPAPVTRLADRVDGGMRQQLLDFNGDGLPDIVRSGYPGSGPTPDARCAASSTAQASCLEVYLNTGAGFGAMEPPIPVPLSQTVQRTSQSGGVSQVYQDLVDINGDGLPDWVSLRTFPPTFGDPWRVLLNLGGTLEPLAYVPHDTLPAPYTEGIAGRVWDGGSGPLRLSVANNTHSDLVDMNGDGFLDAVTSGDATWFVRLHAARERPNLLGLMENGLGGTSTVVYRPSTAFVNTGGDAQPDLPFVTWVVGKTRQSDGLCTPPAGADVFDPGPAPQRNPCIGAGHERGARYDYEDGRFDAAARLFRGFRRVVRTGVEDHTQVANRTVTHFGQEATTTGRILQVETYAGVGALVRLEQNLWSTRAAGSGRTQLWLSENRRATFDLLGAGPHYVATVMDPPDAYGNDLHHYTAGLSGAPRVDTYTTYAAPQSGSSVYDRPSNVRIEDAGGVLQEQWFHYDGNGINGMSLGGVTKGNLKRIRNRLTPTTANGPQTRMGWDELGNLTSATDANGGVTTTAYDAARLHPRVVTNPLGHATTTEIDYRWGQPASVSDVNGAVSQFAYDQAGRRTCVARPGESLANCSTRTAYAFASAPGELSSVEISERQDAPHPPLITRHFYDALGRARHTDSTRVVDGAPVTVRSNQAVYDAGGRIVTLYHPDLASAAAPTNGAVSYDYHLNGSVYVDPLGRVYRATNSDGTSRRSEYFGATTRTVDEAGQRSEATVDALGRVVTQVVFADGAPYATTLRTYDGLGRLREVRQNGVLLTSLSYDALGRKTAMTEANSGTWRYGYDDAGNLLWQDDPAAERHVQFCYDKLDRLTRRCPVAADFASHFSCTSGISCGDPETVLFTYDESDVPNGRGRLTAVEDASGRSEMQEYDARGRLRRMTKHIEVDGVSRHARFAYTYDTNDRPLTVTYPDGEVVITDYDDGGQPIVLRNQANTFYVTDALYDVFGRPTEVHHANGVTDTHSYGAAADMHRLRSIRAAGPAGVLLDLGYEQYSNRGLIEGIADRRNASGVLSNTAAYTYDALGRLTTFDSAHNPGDRTFAYDAMGNLTRNGDRYFGYTNAARPHQLTTLRVGSPTAAPTPIAHDPNGNRAGKGAHTYAYDTSGRLAEVEVGAAAVRFVHDFAGRQVAKIVDGTPPTVARFYSELVETVGTWQTKWYFLGSLRVASQGNTFVGWEVAALDAPVQFATASLDHPALTVLLGREAGWMLAAVSLCLASGLLLAPWRRRPVVGVAVRPGHAIGLALLCAVGTFPWPLVVAPQPVHAGGSGGTMIIHYHADHLGSPQVVSNPSGVVIEQLRYTPYGQLRGRWGAQGQPIVSATPQSREFNGYLGDSLSGLLYAGARFYDPELGTFLTHDPATQFASPYSFGGGDPVNWSDPNGDEFLSSFIIAVIVSAVASAAVNTIIAAAQGLPLNAIGKAALGGAIAGAIGVGLGVVASAATMGAASAAGTLPANVTMSRAISALGDVAYRSAFATTIGNAASQTANAAGASSEVVALAGFAGGLLGGFAYDQLFPADPFSVAVADGSVRPASNSATHTAITRSATGEAQFSQAAADQILAANLDRDSWDKLLFNEDHFDFFAKDTAESFVNETQAALKWGVNPTKFIGGALHHIQDQYALGHIFPGTSFLRGPWGALPRFIIHNVVGGEVTFRQASEIASKNFVNSLGWVGI